MPEDPIMPIRGPKGKKKAPRRYQEERPMYTGQDLSKQEGNPTSALQLAYSELMAIPTAEELAVRIMEIVKESGGVSDKNVQKLIGTIGNIIEVNEGNETKQLMELQKYITNFILAGSGLGVTRIESKEDEINYMGNSIDSDSILGEDICNLISLIENSSKFKVVVLEGKDLLNNLKSDTLIKEAMDREIVDCIEGYGDMEDHMATYDDMENCESDYFDSNLSDVTDEELVAELFRRNILSDYEPAAEIDEDDLDETHDTGMQASFEEEE